MVSAPSQSRPSMASPIPERCSLPYKRKSKAKWTRELRKSRRLLGEVRSRHSYRVETLFLLI